MSKAQFGVIGMGVMGRNLALNVLDHGYSVAVWNRRPEPTKEAVEESGGKLVGCESIEQLCATLERPRKLMLLVKAGAPVDAVIEQLRPHLEQDDIVIDGGNSWFEDTQRREKQLNEAGLHFFGVGVSGGEDGARHGPSLMPGGSKEGYAQIQPILEAIAAKSDSGPCVTHLGPDGAGHFVKMVHNGIEYADMQFIAEAYHLLRELGGLTPPQFAELFSQWNQGRMASFLVEISAKIFTVRDNETDGWLIDHVLDKAGQKGTGRWTVQLALDLGVAIPSIAAAIDARVLSSMKAQRQAASRSLPAPAAPSLNDTDKQQLVKDVESALYAAKLGAYAQGMALIKAASQEHGWAINLKEVARIWKAGCIIRAKLLDDIMQAYERDPTLSNLLFADHFKQGIDSCQAAWRKVVGQALAAGIPVPAMASSLAYYDSYRTAALPQNLTQAQRDAFGSHTYQRVEDPEGPFVHTDWLG